MSPAFAASAAIFPSTITSTSSRSALFAPRPSAAAQPAKRSRVAMMAKPPMPKTPMRTGPSKTGMDEKVPLQGEVKTQKLGLDLPGQQVPQGFTEYSEQLNGRVTMVAFVAAVAAEVLNPAHPTIVQQVGSVMGPINQLLKSIL